MDSTLEIAFKDYLVNESKETYSDKRLFELFKVRSQVQAEIKKTVRISAALWKKVDYYYGMRCKLVHERVSVSISDTDINSFMELVQILLGRMFKLKFVP